MFAKKRPRLESARIRTGHNSRQNSIHDISYKLAKSRQRPTIDTTLQTFSNAPTTVQSTRNSSARNRIKSTNSSYFNSTVNISKLNSTISSNRSGTASGSRSGSRSGSIGPKPQPSSKSQFPCTAKVALKQHHAQLSSYEQAEILDYPEVYFLGNKNKKINVTTTNDNFGFDDDRGDYKLVPGDHIQYRYEVLELLGKGSFGQVVKVHDHKRNEPLALKIIRNAARFHKQAAVEIKTLKTLITSDSKDKATVIHIRQYFVFRKHVCIVFELLSNNLYEFLKSNRFQGLSSNLIRRFGTQILMALRLFKKCRIIHCDMKPENIMLKEPTKSTIKVIDLGSSCFEDQRIYTYIQSRFYRAPEIMLGIPYTVAIDMWSLGCILVELVTGYPLFPGDSEAEQLAMIMEMKGVPPEKLLEQATRRKLFFEPSGKPKIVANSKGKLHFPGTRKLPTMPDPDLANLVERWLDWDPRTRITPSEALKHPFVFREEAQSVLGSTTKGINRDSASKPPHKTRSAVTSYGDIHMRVAPATSKAAPDRKFHFN